MLETFGLNPLKSQCVAMYYYKLWRKNNVSSTLVKNTGVPGNMAVGSSLPFEIPTAFQGADKHWFHKHYLEVTIEVPGIVEFIESESTVEEPGVEV